MFLGDCCYDYLLESDPRKLGIAEARHEQYSVFRRFTPRSSCVYVAFNKALKMVITCPSDVQNENTTESMCSDLQGKRTGGRLNKKDGLTRYGNSHVKDKTS